jgi:hypothetical protein
MIEMPNPVTALDAGGPVLLHIGRQRPGASEFLRWRVWVAKLLKE